MRFENYGKDVWLTFSEKMCYLHGYISSNFLYIVTSKQMEIEQAQFKPKYMHSTLKLQNAITWLKRFFTLGHSSAICVTDEILPFWDIMHWRVKYRLEML